MSQKITIENFSSLNLVENTELSADANLGATTFNILNPNGFTDDSIFVIGLLESETLEKFVVDSISGFVVTTTATSIRAHKKFEQVNKLFGNQIKIYRASNSDGSLPDDSDFSLLATVDIDFDQGSTNYTDATGSSSYWYKSTYYNSTSSAETSLTNSVGIRGGGFGDYCSIELIRKEAGLLTNKYVSDADIDQKRKAAQDEINGTLIGLYEVPFTNPVPDIIVEITAKLAAGMLLMSPAGNSYVNTSQEGSDKVKEARAELDKIKVKAKTIVVNGESIAMPNVGGFSMYPDKSTANKTPAEGGPRFTQDMVY